MKLIFQMFIVVYMSLVIGYKLNVVRKVTQNLVVAIVERVGRFLNGSLGQFAMPCLHWMRPSFHQCGVGRDNNQRCFFESVFKGV